MSRYRAIFYRETSGRRPRSMIRPSDIIRSRAFNAYYRLRHYRSRQQFEYVRSLMQRGDYTEATDIMRENFRDFYGVRNIANLYSYQPSGAALGVPYVYGTSL